MRTIELAAIGLVALGAAMPALARPDVLGDLTAKHHIDVGEAAAAVVVGKALGMKVEDLVELARRIGRPVDEIAPAIVISMQTNQPVEKVWKKSRGHGWGVVAKSLGMHPGTFNKMRVKRQDFEQIVWINLAGKALGCNEGTWDSLRKRGMDRRDALRTLVLANGDPKKLEAIAQGWTEHKGWERADEKRADDEPSGKGQGQSKGRVQRDKDSEGKRQGRGRGRG